MIKRKMIKNIVFLPGWSFTAGIWKVQAEYFASLGFNIISCEPEDIAYCLKNIEINKSVFVAWSLGWFKLAAALQKEKTLPCAVVVVSGAIKFKGSLLRLIIRDFKKDAESLLVNFNQWLFTDKERVNSGAFRELNFISSNRISNQDKLLADLLFLRNISLDNYLSCFSNVSVLLIAGRYDAICPLDATVELGRRLPRAEFKILDTGHIPFITKADEFNKIIEKSIF